MRARTHRIKFNRLFAQLSENTENNDQLRLSFELFLP